MARHLSVSPLMLMVDTAAGLLRETRASGRHEAADRICADLAAVQRAIALTLNGEPAPARTPQSPN